MSSDAHKNYMTGEFLEIAEHNFKSNHNKLGKACENERERQVSGVEIARPSGPPNLSFSVVLDQNQHQLDIIFLT